MQVETNQTFSVLKELSKGNTYQLLFPEARAGMAIVWLYEKLEAGVFEKGCFKEKDIHEALRAINPAIELDKSRHPHEHYNKIIADLQEFFLRYDDDRQEYSFKQYAYEFCQKAHGLLEASFSPTRIERICTALRVKLETCNSYESVVDWFTLDFNAFKPQLKSQVDFLDKQIDYSIASLRQNKKLNLQEREILQTLRQIDDGFEIIRSQNKELRAAFKEVDEIRRIMDLQRSQFDYPDILEFALQSASFFHEMRRTLAIIDKRLDRIQPKVRQLFANLNKPLFNTRVENFLAFLLTNSTERTDGTKKLIDLPNSVRPIPLVRYRQQLTIVERRENLFPPKPQKRRQIDENPVSKANAFAIINERLKQQDQVTEYIEAMRQEVAIKGSLLLSEKFFDILEGQSENRIALAIAVLYHAVSAFSKDNGYHVTVDQNKTITKLPFKTTLWEISISTK